MTPGADLVDVVCCLAEVGRNPQELHKIVRAHASAEQSCILNPIPQLYMHDFGTIRFCPSMYIYVVCAPADV
eukprot:6455163-Amphidinium_carterae.2